MPITYVFASETNTKPIMEKINLNEGLMAVMLEEEAWKNLSYDFNWSEQLLEKFSDRIPASILKDSRLWNVLVGKKQEEILKRICLEK